MTPYFVYFLRCADQSLYTGICTNLEQRLHAHNFLASGAKYTKQRRPVTLVYFEKYPDRSSALKREYVMRHLSRLEKLALIDTLSR
jgi:putative endonuclease